MNRVRLLLSIDSRLLRQLIVHELDRRASFEVVGHSLDPISVLAIMTQERPQAWIHTWGGRPDFPAILSHARSLLPELAIVDLDREDEFGVLQIPVSSLEDVVVQLSRYVESLESGLVEHR